MTIEYRLLFSALSLTSMLLACSSSSTTTTTTKDAGTKLAVVGDDCGSDSMCASGLCGSDGACATPASSLDGGKCSSASDCKKGDLCESSSGRCYVPPSDAALNAATPCTTNADCSSDETCTNHTCQG